MLVSFHKKITSLIDEMEKVILGKRDILQLTVTALLAGGHVLFEDIPGVGKTTMVKTLAKATHGTFNRVQFTPDLLPNDILGVSTYDSLANTFQFHPGPVFTSVLLADEINRTSPRTQAALLEAMSEKQVTIDNQTYPLNEHFFVLATQNPIEYEGTYTLPEAQLDRFLFKLQIGYPEFSDELALLQNQGNDNLSQVTQVLDAADICQLKKVVTEIYIDPQVASYALQLVQASRKHPAIKLGISPRGFLSFVQAAKAFALTEGRSYVVPNDFQKILSVTFGHRLLLKNGQPSAEQLQEILEQLLKQVPVPIRK